MSLSLLVLTLASSGLAGGALVYLVVSFVLMRPHVPTRKLGATVRELAREALWVALSQPLLPWFYVFGRKLGGKGSVPVVFVHGYFQNRVDFLYLAHHMRQRGFGPLYGFNYNWLRAVPNIAESLARFVEVVRKETGAPAVDLVCHSMGGLVAGHALAKDATLVRRVVTIATPHRGISYRGPILGASRGMLRKGHGLAQLAPVPWLSVYSTHDNVVHPSTSSLVEGEGNENVEAGAVGHLAILFSPLTANAVSRFLRAPREAQVDAPAVVEEVAVPVAAADVVDEPAPPDGTSQHAA